MRRTPIRLTQLESRDTPVAGFTVAGAAPGGLPLVAVFRPDGTVLAQFPAFETTFRGGVRAVAGELDGDPNTQELVAGAGPGGGPAVKVYSVDVRTGAVIPRSAFFAFEPTFRGGVRVTAGNVAARPDGLGQIVVGAGEGGGPRVRTVDLNGTQVNTALGDFFAFDPSFRGGVQVAAGELDGSTATGAELVATAGTGGGPRVRVLRSDGAVLADYFAFTSAFRGGANVTVVNGQIVPDAFVTDPSQRNAALNAAAGASATATTVVTTPSVTTVSSGTVGPVGGGAADISGATAAGGVGTITQSGLTGATGATGLNSQAIGAGGITGATAATGISAQGLGGGGFGTLAVAATSPATLATSTGGVTSTVTAGGLTTVGFADAARTSSVQTVPAAFRFGPFGDPGPAITTPVLAAPPFAFGSRFVIPV